MQTFTDFKKDFYGKVNDLSLFDFGKYNALKIILDGFKVNYVARGKVRSFLFYPTIIYSLFCFLKRCKLKFSSHEDVSSKLKELRKKKFLILDNGRIVVDENRNAKSLYFENILNTLGKENVVIITEKNINLGLKNQLVLPKLKDNFMYASLTKEEKKFRKEIIESFIRIKQSGKFSDIELLNIQFAFHSFFREYKVFNRLLSYLKEIEKCYLVCHYHKEGQICALKEKNIECIELQHGLIASQDIFYIFPSQVKQIKDKTFFADKILVYGQYWKDILQKGAEYDTSQIGVIGYYLYDDFIQDKQLLQQVESLIDKKEPVLVTTQTYLHEVFIEFIQHLSKELMEQDYIIIVKPHPAEKKEIYTSAFETLSNVTIVNFPVSTLFKKIKNHISIYSTTLYDATRYQVRNFVFKTEGCEDYVEEIIKTGIAEEIISSGDLILKLESQQHTIERESEHYYQVFDSEVLKMW